MLDPRNIRTGRTIPTESYADQPYVVVLPDHSWLCVLTTGAGHEGDAGQHVVSLRSFNQGQTWTDKTAIERPDGPVSSWGVPLHVPDLGGPLGRVYAFYVYNLDNVSEVETTHGPTKRVDTLGHYCFRYSDDGGQTWSAERYEVPVRAFAIDHENPYGGEIRFFWSVCKPLKHDGGAYLAVHKVGYFGEGFMARSEGAFLVSDNILYEPDPAKLRWQTLPDGEVGLRAVEQAVADEQNLTALSDGTLFCTYRTIDGFSCHAYSRDGGHTWTPPAHMTYGPGQRKVKHPRAANFVRRFANGKFLYWFHNHGLGGYDGRNPVWLLGGHEIDTPAGKQIQWSQPEVLLYDEDIATRISYPDFIEDGGRLFVTETQKTVARAHDIPPELLNWLWNVPTPVPEDSGYVETSTPGTIEMPLLPELWKTRGGFTLQFRLKFDDLTPHQLLFDSRDSSGYGITVSLTDKATLVISLSGWLEDDDRRCGEAVSVWESDPGLVHPGKWHEATVIIDGGPKLVLWIIDGQLCDGGETRPFGWGYFHPNLNDLNASKQARIAQSLRGELAQFRLYPRRLFVNEARSGFTLAPLSPCPSPRTPPGS